jgi:hypothetical protein
VDEARAETVVRIYREYVAGDGYGLILGRLVAEGVPPITDGQPARPGVEHRWSVRLISRLLRSKAVMGERVMMRRLENGTRVPTGERSMAYPEIVSPELWQQAKAAHDRRTVVRDRGESGNLLAGLSRCLHCNGIMVRSGPANRPVMRCNNRYVNRTCKLGSTYAREQVEQGLRAALSRIISLPVTNNRADDERRIGELRAQVEIETDALSALYSQQARNKHPDALRRAIDRSETDLSALADQLASAEAMQTQRLILTDSADMQARVDALWDAATDDASSRAKLREIIRQYVEHAMFGDDGMVVLHLRQHRGVQIGIMQGKMAFIFGIPEHLPKGRKKKTWASLARSRKGALEPA